MPNRLAQQSSPYLLQHQDNPVDWYPWGPEALERARKEDKPIFLSIGYSACHWCHVMEHESFENEAIAQQLNRHFVCIKVDREERPDLDQIYMNAVQALTGRGGWPMSVFLTPDCRPFYAGTYWPPRAKQGMPGFDQVVDAVAKAWETNRDATLEMAGQVTEHLQANANATVTPGEPSLEVINKAVAALRQSYDSHFGGFGGAPKFPAPMSLRVLLRHWYRTQDPSSLEMVLGTLKHMAAGGIYDHLGGGFARYSVDARWLVPHFEKMLYDNALLAHAYLEAFQVTGDRENARVVRETLDYVLRDMNDAQGGFYSTEDADSEGVEGKFYTWTPEQIAEVLGSDAAETFCRVYDVTVSGNFEETNILNLPKTIADQAKLLARETADLEQELAEARAKLFAAREKRVHPHKDDKVITAWNGLMIEALAMAGAVLGEEKYLQTARKAAEFVHTNLTNSAGRLYHTWRNGEAKVDAYLDDYAYLASGLVSLYEATSDTEYLQRAEKLMHVVLEHFADANSGGFYYTADDQEQLLVRHKEWADNAVPSSNATAVLVLLRLGKLLGKPEFEEAATRTLRAAHGFLTQYPTALAQMLLAVDFQVGPTYELVLAAEPAANATRDIERDLWRRFVPNKVIARAGGDQPSTPLLEGKTMLADAPTLYVCEGYTCQAPARGAEEIEHALDELTRTVEE